MPPFEEDEDDEEENYLAAISQAFDLTGLQSAPNAASRNSSSGDDDSEDDLELLRSIQNHHSIASDLFRSPLRALSHVGSDDGSDDDDRELRAIDSQFLALNPGMESMVDALKKNIEELHEANQAHASTLGSEEDTASLVKETDTSEGSLDHGHSCNGPKWCDNVENKPSDWRQAVSSKISESLDKTSITFPKPALVLMDAIKKNRSYQEFLRNKLGELGARIQENKKVKDRVKILKDFQATCRKKTGHALSQKKDPQVKLISAQKLQTAKNANDKKVSAMYCGPGENSHVANYRMALTKYPLSVDRRKWSDAEKENLRKGIKQQFQEMVYHASVDQLSTTYGGMGGSRFDEILASVADVELTPEEIRKFLPKVNWDRLASSYFHGRTGSECETRWLNHEDPLINHNAWTSAEDKKLLLILQEVGTSNWFEIATLLRTRRTPFQCLARFQRSLNANILKSEWTKDEDAQLCAHVEAFGESNWQAVAHMLEGRTGTQCSNRWKKSLNPARKKVGRWTPDEDKRLAVAAMLFGSKNWKKIAQLVPGRTDVQCRERWVNSLDPSLNWNKWTVEEDSRLKAAIREHGYCWSKVAACVPPRTDNQCRRRWGRLLPAEVPLLRAAKNIQKTALISNFVDREAERPALGPNDFVPISASSSISEPKTVKSSRKQKGISRGREKSTKENDASSLKTSDTTKSKRPAKKAQVSSEAKEKVNNGCNTMQKKRRVSKRLLQKRGRAAPRGVDPKNLGRAEGDDATLPSFLSKKRKIAMDKKSSYANFQSIKRKRGESSSKRVEQLTAGNLVQSAMNGEPKNSCNGEVTENQSCWNMMSSDPKDMPTIASIDKNHGILGTVRGEANRACGPHENLSMDDDNITLACWLKKSKNRKRKLH